MQKKKEKAKSWINIKTAQGHFHLHKIFNIQFLALKNFHFSTRVKQENEVDCMINNIKERKWKDGEFFPSSISALLSKKIEGD